MGSKRRTRGRQTDNSKVGRTLEDSNLSLDFTDVKTEKTKGNLFATPSPTIPPLNEWAALFAAADRHAEPELGDWDITLQDGLNDELV